ncbi:MAG: YqgQ family protein [Gemella sp.]|nr:YqgQ family protein [Gemella sp.]
MKNFYDVQQLLKSYGIVIYMQDRKQHLDLVEFEIRELYRTELIQQKEFLLAIAIINQERQHS